jgi:hypothetical protein
MTSVPVHRSTTSLPIGRDFVRRRGMMRVGKRWPELLSVPPPLTSIGHSPGIPCNPINGGGEE